MAARSRARCESFIFRVNATDALISAFDNISFFLDLQRSSLNCALLLLSGSIIERVSVCYIFPCARYLVG